MLLLASLLFPALAFAEMAVEIIPGLTHYGGHTSSVEIIPGVKQFSGSYKGTVTELARGDHLVPVRDETSGAEWTLFDPIHRAPG